MKRASTSIEDFKELIDRDYYYVDKTEFIQHANVQKVALYTRPRRFGKTLNMSMLYYFYSLKEKENAYLFNGLKIGNDQKALKEQNQYPVIVITFKEMDCLSFDEQAEQFSYLIAREVKKYPELYESASLDEGEKQSLNRLRFEQASKVQLMNSLQFVSQCLEKHYGKKTVILIDEYDVPLQSAYLHGYYDEMVLFMKNLFSAALKTNPSLEKGILTGCLRIAKESIFTGLNNFHVYSIFDDRTASYYGFTPEETFEMLEYYQLDQYYGEVREWYDGYQFGGAQIYNPWSVISFVDGSTAEKPRLEAYWANTSSNSIVYDYIQKGNENMKEEFQALLRGQSVEKEIMPEMTYRDMEDIDHIYSFMLFTGYLKNLGAVCDRDGHVLPDTYELVIPNREVKEVFRKQYQRYFRHYSKEKKTNLLAALKAGDTKKGNQLLNDILFHSISFFDNYEAFYHGFVIGLFSDYHVKSNRESGDGRFDVAILTDDIFDTNVLIECKWTKERKELRKVSEEAAAQIVELKYIEGLKEEGYEKIIGYGIGFYEKSCIITKV